MTTTTQIRSQINDLNAQLAIAKSRQADLLASKKYNEAAVIQSTINQLTAQIHNLTLQLNSEYSSSRSTVKVNDGSLVNTDNSDLKSLRKYQNSEIVGDTGPYTVATNNSITGTGRPQDTGQQYKKSNTSKSEARLGAAIGFGMAGYNLWKTWDQASRSTEVSVQRAGGLSLEAPQDLRVRIIIPKLYLNQAMSHNIIENGGIIFPYTPSVSFEQSAQYTQPNILHSNFPINMYQRSTIGNISIQGKFTVENRDDAITYLSTIKLLRALTKMRWGNDENAGSPPPVCKLMAYGDEMLDNIPVAITSFKQDIPENVDYYTYQSYDSAVSKVPVLSSISVTLIPMYSRKELSEFSVDKMMSDYPGTRNKGFI